jgi:hypothetical protein
VSTQLPAHAVVPSGHIATHIESPQNSPDGHVMAHAPQLVGSSVVSTQTPEQSVVPPVHSHMLSTHSIPPEQTMPQPPQ